MIPYNPDLYATGFGFLRIIFALRGTVIPHVLKSGMFWMTLVVHIVFHIIEFFMHYRFEGQEVDELDERELWTGWSNFRWSGLESSFPGKDGLPRIPWEVGTVSLTLCVFFLVFYTNSMHTRFQEFHAHVVGIGGHTMVWIGLVKIHLTCSPEGADSANNRQWNAVRHVLGAMQVFYYTINSTGVRYEELDAQGVDDFEWQTMVERGVVGAREARWLANYKGFKPWLLLTWAMTEVGAQLDELARTTGSTAGLGKQRLPKSAVEHGVMEAAEELRRRNLASLVVDFRATAFALRFHMGQINALRDMQTPFPYFHLINLLLVLNLLLVAYIAVPWCALPMSLFIVFIMLVAFLGMRSIAIKLADPFGTNRLDFDLEGIMCGCYNEAVAQLSMKKQPTTMDSLPDGMKAGEQICNPITVAQASLAESSCCSSPGSDQRPY